MSPDIVAAVAALEFEGTCWVALGGGADSSVLLVAAVEAFGPERVAGLFVDHGLEGSAMLRTSAETLGATLGVAVRVVPGRVPDGPDLEARARQVRYAAIDPLIGPGDVCCTGHTRDDQAETVLMRLMRGAGATGLSGIPSTRGRFRRPLLEFSRARLRRTADELSLPYTDDMANNDPRFLRSRVRNDLIPMIEAGYSDAFRDNLARSAALVQQDDTVLEELAAGAPVCTLPDEATIPTALLATSAHAVRARIVRRALAGFFDPYHGGHRDIEAVLATVDDGAQRNLAGGLTCLVEHGQVVIFAKRATAVPEPRAIHVGSTFEWAGHQHVVKTGIRPAMLAVCPRRIAVRHPGDAALGIRAVAEGDRLDIEGGTTPVSELLRAAGIPPRNRTRSMLITVDGDIAGVFGVRVAPWARPIGGETAVIIEREGHS
jgi:tRNA(Ile)-lysidine synthase